MLQTASKNSDLQRSDTSKRYSDTSKRCSDTSKRRSDTARLRLALRHPLPELRRLQALRRRRRLRRRRGLPVAATGTSRPLCHCALVQRVQHGAQRTAAAVSDSVGWRHVEFEGSPSALYTPNSQCDFSLKYRDTFAAKVKASGAPARERERLLESGTPEDARAEH